MVHAMSSGWTYYWEGDESIGKEIVIESGQIHATTSHELDGGLNLQTQGIVALDGAEDIFMLFLQDLWMSLQVFSNDLSFVEG